MILESVLCKTILKKNWKQVKERAKINFIKGITFDTKRCKQQARVSMSFIRIIYERKFKVFFFAGLLISFLFCKDI